MIYKFTHSVIRTPSDTLNVVGAGGLNQSTITEAYGEPGAGKSAFAYDCASMFLDDNPDGIVLIIDPEVSVDLIRLKHVFKLDMDRVILRNARTLEAGFAEIYKAIAASDEQMKAKDTVKSFIENFKYAKDAPLLKELADDIDFSSLVGKEWYGDNEKKLIRKIATHLAFTGKLKPARPTPVLIIWDTIAASKPRLEVEAAMRGEDPLNAGGVGLRSRVLDEALGVTMTSLFGKPITIFILNQVRLTGFMTYRGPYESSSGGFAFKHAAHYKLKFQKTDKPVFDEENMMKVGAQVKIDIEKSKFGPELKGIPIFIDTMGGGRIVPKDEAAWVCRNLKLLNATGGPWWKFSDDLDTSYTWEPQEKLGTDKSGKFISNNPKVRQKCNDILARHFRINYVTLDIVYQHAGIKMGELNDEQIKKREELVSKFSFAPVLTSGV